MQGLQVATKILQGHYETGRQNYSGLKSGFSVFNGLWCTQPNFLTGLCGTT